MYSHRYESTNGEPLQKTKYIRIREVLLEVLVLTDFLTAMANCNARPFNEIYGLLYCAKIIVLAEDGNQV